MLYQYLIFDLDGTLTNPKPGILRSINYALNFYSLPTLDESKDDTSWLIGPPLRDDFRDILGEKAEESLIEKLVAAYRKRFETIGIFENSLYPGIEVILHKLNNGEKRIKEGERRRLALATTKPTVFAQRILSHFGIDVEFDFVIGSELDGRRSSKEELIRSVIDHYGRATVANYLMIGDRKHDVLGAKAAGIDSVGVLYGYGKEPEIRDSKPTYVAGSVGELGELLWSL